MRPQRDYVRFEAAAPNDLWQMDFKGQFGLTAGGKCYPFTAIDDHSRFLVNLTAGPNNQKETVKGDLTTPSLQIDKGVIFEGRSFMEGVTENSIKTSRGSAASPPSPPPKGGKGNTGKIATPHKG